MRTSKPAHRTTKMRHPARSWGYASLALLVIAGLCVWLGLRGQQVPLPPPVRQPPSHVTTSTALPAALVTARSAPVSLRIPAIGLSVPLSTLGLNLDGTVQVPTDFQEPGWYRLGPSPGEMGSAVILGHVDSYLGPAVFFQLRSLTAGDQVEVTLADGVMTSFVVTSVAMYPKTGFPAQQVYGSHGSSALQLVTCGGTFDAQTGSYLSNIVVYTSLQTITAPDGGS